MPIGFAVNAKFQANCTVLATVTIALYNLIAPVIPATKPITLPNNGANQFKLSKIQVIALINGGNATLTTVVIAFEILPIKPSKSTSSNLAKIVCKTSTIANLKVVIAGCAFVAMSAIA